MLFLYESGPPGKKLLTRKYDVTYVANSNVTTTQGERSFLSVFIVGQLYQKFSTAGIGFERRRGSYVVFFSLIPNGDDAISHRYKQMPDAQATNRVNDAVFRR